ncbi:MAG: NUDIX hydrolase [Elusimicrobiota bacterium]
MSADKASGLKKTRFEFSAGGVVREGSNLLMVKVENLEGRQLWTFPKGHIEAGEKAEQAALREVEEETGYHCEIIKPLDRAQYWFKRENKLTKKTVTWFLMKPLKKTGLHDPEEILETRWFPISEACRIACYRSDKKILENLAKL